jgi:LDH2 family malate/lactate/ureidoglycolate dehydrogenase
MLGFGLVSHALGGILSGMVTRQEEQASLWKGVNQGAFFIVVDAAQMASDLPTYQRQMDEFLVALGKMQPPPGHERAYAPGGIEAERERLWSVEGIPVGDEPAWGGASHLEILQKVAAELDIETPW